MENMTAEEIEEIDKQFWINAEHSVDTLIGEWKARKFTRKQMVVGAVNAFTNNKHGIIVGSYIYAVMAERLINSMGDGEQAKAE